MDFGGENPFADLMSKAVKLKGAQQAQLRTTFDSWPQHLQHSLFMQESVLSARALAFPARLAAAEAMKARGNASFAAGELEEAVAEYEKALAVFKFVVNADPGWKTKGIEDVDLHVEDYSCLTAAHTDAAEDQRRLDALKLSCYLNIAAAKLKLREFLACIRACDDALELEPACVKALFRRAQARITPASAGALEMDSAISDLQRAYAADPQCREVCRLLRALKQQRVRQRALDKQTFSGMFERGEVYAGDDGGERGPGGGAQATEAQAARELEDAERLAHMLECKGQPAQAAEVRARVAQARAAQARRLKRVDFFHPTPEMIRDAKENGIDLTDRSVQQMLHDMQEDEREGRTPGAQAEARAEARAAARAAALPTVASEREAVDAVLRSMSNAQVAELLRAEGIDHHEMTDREQFEETARQVLRSKLGAPADGGEVDKASPSMTRSIVLFAAAWTLMRLYSTGGLAAIGRLLFGSPGGELAADAGLVE